MVMQLPHSQRFPPFRHKLHSWVAVCISRHGPASAVQCVQSSGLTPGLVSISNSLSMFLLQTKVQRRTQVGGAAAAAGEGGGGGGFETYIEAG